MGQWGRQALVQRRLWGYSTCLGAAVGLGLPSTSRSPSTALKSSPSKKGRGALLAVKPLGPTAAFSASQIPSEREDAQYDLRGARSYPTLEDEGEQVAGRQGGREGRGPCAGPTWMGGAGSQSPPSAQDLQLRSGQPLGGATVRAEHRIHPPPPTLR